MRTKWSGTVSQDAVLIKLRRRLRLILSSWPVNKKEKEGGYEKEGKRKERRKRKEEEIEPIHNYDQKVWQRRRNFIIRERESVRKEVSTTHLRFFIRCIRGKVHWRPPPPPNSPKLPPLSLTLKNTSTTSFNKDNSANFSGGSKEQWSFPGYLFF